MLCSHCWVPGARSYGTVMRLPALWEIIKHFLSRGSRCHFDSTCRHTLHQFWFNCFEMLLTTKGGAGHVLREIACKELPCGRRLLCIWHLEVILLYVMRQRISRLRPCLKLDGLTALFARVNILPSFISSCQNSTNVCIYCVSTWPTHTLHNFVSSAFSIHYTFTTFHIHYMHLIFIQYSKAPFNLLHCTINAIHDTCYVIHMAVLSFCSVALYSGGVPSLEGHR